MIYQPTQEEILAVKEFAKNSAKYHRKKRRSLEEVVSDIIVGKLGEFAYKYWMSESVSDVNLTVSEIADEGWDFVKADGTRVQVKTLRSDAKWVSFNNWYWEELVVIRYHVNYLELEHIKNKSEINGIAKSSKFGGWYYEA
jgi:hypothetical protein